MDKLHIDRPIIVEGKYDRARIESVAHANIITTDGFGIFTRREKLALLRRLAADGGVILLTDSDGAGGVIRSYITSSLPAGSVIQLYVPSVKGKEKRKKTSSRAGVLGVEGIDPDVIYKLLYPFSRECGGGEAREVGGITKTDFYAYGLSGGERAQSLRDELSRRLELPPSMTANALLAAVNVLIGKSEFERIASELCGGADSCDAEN